MPWILTNITQWLMGSGSKSSSKKRRSGGYHPKYGRLAYRTRAGKRVWLWANHDGDFEADSSWTCTGRRSYGAYGASGRIGDSLPEWVWNVLAESPRPEEGTGTVYLVNGKKNQYLYNVYVDEEGINYEAYRREKR